MLFSAQVLVFHEGLEDLVIDEFLKVRNFKIAYKALEIVQQTAEIALDVRTVRFGDRKLTSVLQDYTLRAILIELRECPTNEILRCVQVTLKTPGSVRRYQDWRKTWGLREDRVMHSYNRYYLSGHRGKRGGDIGEILNKASEELKETNENPNFREGTGAWTRLNDAEFVCIAFRPLRASKSLRK